MTVLKVGVEKGDQGLSSQLSFVKHSTSFVENWDSVVLIPVFGDICPPTLSSFCSTRV